MEGLGIVFLEAQACGVATIAGSGGGAPETVVDGQTGTVVNGRDVGQVAASIVDLLSDANLRHSIATAGRQRVEAAWTWEQLAHQWVAVMEGHGGVPPRVAWNVPM